MSTQTETRSVWLERTLALIKRANEAGLTYRQISDATGVNVFWLNKVRWGEISDPSVKRIQRVHDYLFAQDEAGWPAAGSGRWARKAAAGGESA